MKKSSRRLSTVALAAVLFAAMPSALALAAPLLFTPLVLINDWTVYSADVRRPSAALDSENVVHLRGAMQLTIGSSALPFVLPLKFRPSKEVYVAVTLVNGKPGRLAIFPSGVVGIQAGYNITDAFFFTSLEGVTYAKN